MPFCNEIIEIVEICKDTAHSSIKYLLLLYCGDNYDITIPTMINFFQKMLQPCGPPPLKDEEDTAAQD